MNSAFEHSNTRPSMADMKAMQQTALSRNIDKAGNIQKAVTLTEENWTGLTNAVELTGQSVLQLQEVWSICSRTSRWTQSSKHRYSL